jgi:2-polyprenyl-3-methyl-5-hydroxy-6-metoxy-1,4-benzoquinol methylase
MGDPATLPAMSTGRAPRRSQGRLRANPGGTRALLHLHGLIVPPLRRINAGLRALCAGSHHLQYRVEGFLRPSAEWFDHEIDVQWQWVARQRSMFLERGILNTLAIRPGAELLEICCGDGFNAHRFYAERARRVLAVDRDGAALRHARRFHARANVEYRHCDILAGVPRGSFDNVVWDAAMHHFTPAEVSAILASVHGSLAGGGVLSGYTVIEPDEDYAYTRLRFSGPEALIELLTGEFAHVAVLETPDALRRNLYFFASEDPRALPFTPGVHQGPTALLRPTPPR